MLQWTPFHFEQSIVTSPSPYLDTGLHRTEVLIHLCKGQCPMLLGFSWEELRPYAYAYKPHDVAHLVPVHQQGAWLALTLLYGPCLLVCASLMIMLLLAEERRGHLR